MNNTVLYNATNYATCKYLSCDMHFHNATNTDYRSTIQFTKKVHLDVIVIK